MNIGYCSRAVNRDCEASHFYNAGYLCTCSDISVLLGGLLLPQVWVYLPALCNSPRRHGSGHAGPRPGESICAPYSTPGIVLVSSNVGVSVPAVLWPLFLALVVGCGSEAPTSSPDPRSLIDALLEAPSDAEVAAVYAELAGRFSSSDPGGIEILETRTGTFSDLSLVAYQSDGLRIYGVVSRPKSPGRYPVVLYNHGGDRGLSLADLDTPLSGALVLAASSFRSEAVHWFGADFRSDGPESPWDRDVDDALALLECVSRLPDVDPTRVAALGGSRGGGVSLLAAVRLPGRFRCVVDIFGPTDFFDPVFRPVVDTLSAGGNDPRPGMAFLKESVLQPYLSGALSLHEARSQLIRRSGIYFADRLPPVQIHHGADDTVVPPSQSDRLARRLEGLGVPFEYYQYPGAGHDWPLASESLPRILGFLERYL